MIKRRQFFQFASSTLATIALSNLKIQRQGLMMAKSLAQNNPRKIALLVGINDYSDRPLKGCVHDVYSYQELLIHRFGFKPQDILMVTDDSEIKPTRENILQAFESHLIEQVKPGDVAVFQYSGHGSRVVDPDSIAVDKLSSTICPANRNRKKVGEEIIVSDITGRTLYLLMAGVNTNNLTVVLDSCHSGGGTRGNYRVRSLARSDYDVDKPSTIELEYRHQLRQKLKLTNDDLPQEIARGIIFASSKPEQLSVDGNFDGFFSGVFSYVLTRYLWQLSDPTSVPILFDQVSRQTSTISNLNQVPEYQIASNQPDNLNFLSTMENTSGDGVILQREGKNVEMWLGGLSAFSLGAFNQGSKLTAVDNQGQTIGEIQLIERKGLKAKGRICNETASGAIAYGSILREKVRLIPKDFRLKVGVDSSLKTTPSNLANQSQLKRIEFRELQQYEVDYIIGRVTVENQDDFKPLDGFDTPPSVNGIGLFSPALVPIADSFGSPTESISQALKRLQPKLNGLLAIRWLKLALNADSSRLFVRAEMLTGKQKIASKIVRGDNKSRSFPEQVPNDFTDRSTGQLKIPIGTEIIFNITNEENRNLYLTILGVDSEGSISIVFPNIWSGEADVNLLAPADTKVIPSAGDDFNLSVLEPLGVTEILIVVSSSPMASVLKSLTKLARGRGVTRGPQGLRGESLSVVDDLLIDLDSTGGENNNGCPVITSDSLRTEIDQLAAFSFSFIATN